MIAEMRRFFVGLCLILANFSGAFLWCQDWGHLATIATDVSPGETVLNVYWTCSGSVDRAVLIQSRDGRLAALSGFLFPGLQHPCRRECSSYKRPASSHHRLPNRGLDSSLGRLNDAAGQRC